VILSAAGARRRDGCASRLRKDETATARDDRWPAARRSTSCAALKTKVMTDEGCCREGRIVLDYKFLRGLVFLQFFTIYYVRVSGTNLSFIIQRSFYSVDKLHLMFLGHLVRFERHCSYISWRLLIYCADFTVQIELEADQYYYRVVFNRPNKEI
jgi:hypothetical protein